jgi:hypothetical protein
MTMVDNYEKAKGESSEWRTPRGLLDAIGLEYALDPCGPSDGGYYAVPARQTYTVHDNGLVRPWHGLVFVNPPWSETRRAVVPWLRRFFIHPGGGIFVCVARTSCDYWHEDLLPHVELLCFPRRKTRFIRSDGSPGPSPTNGIALLAKGDIACAALCRSELGFCLIVDRSATLAPSEAWSQFSRELLAWEEHAP